MKESDRATGISCVLLHKEDVSWDLFWLKVLALDLFELYLDRGFFIEKQDANCWFGEHFQSPLLSGKHLME